MSIYYLTCICSIIPAGRFMRRNTNPLMNENMLYGSAYPFGGLKEGIRYSLDNYNFQDEQTKENYFYLNAKNVLDI